MYIYLDQAGYVYGYGSEYEDGSVEVAAIPEEVDAYLGAYRYENGNYYLDSERKNSLIYQRQLSTELTELNRWFDWYDEQCIQYQRAQRMGQDFDRDIEEMDRKASENAQRIRQIETEMTQQLG